MSEKSPQPRRRRRYRVPRGFAGTTGDPYANVLDLDRGHRRVAIAIACALSFHLALVSIGVLVPRRVALPPATKEIVVTAEPPRPPPAVPPAPKPAAPPPPEARRAPSSPRPAAAKAGKVIARAAEPAGPLDLSGFDLVTGKSESFSGGFTASEGTSQKAVVDSRASAHGTGDGHGAASAARPAQPGRHDWACGWPEDAQETDLRDARVGIRVAVSPDGAPEHVEVVSSPAPTFAEAARRCALSEQYKPALDAAGHRIGGLSALFLVHFLR